MILRLNQQPNIEDLRHHGPEAVEKLRRLLAYGALAKPDPCRSDFFELEDGNKVFYIHISPVNGKVLLLATWLKDEEAAEMMASHQVVQPHLAAAMKLVPTPLLRQCFPLGGRLIRSSRSTLARKARLTPRTSD